MKFIDLFAGVGGFRYGIEKAFELVEDSTSEVFIPNKQKPKGRWRKWKYASCVYSNEWDKYANSVYRKHYGECDDRDIRTVESEEIPDHDLLCGGFPCQSFSVAGKRGGFDDTRGTLFFEIARILRDKRPRYFLLENVKGLLSHDSGKTFQTIIGVLSDIGYGVQWQVLNSKDFGVPQNRERVFIVGHLRGTSRPEVFPIFGTNREIDEQPNKKRFLKWSKSRGMDSGKLRKEERLLKSDVAQTLSTGDGCFNFSSGNYTDDTKIRKLTPVECERLQGFPDNWTKYGHDGKEMSDTQRYKMMGNAVTTNVITKIMKTIE